MITLWGERAIFSGSFDVVPLDINFFVFFFQFASNGNEEEIGKLLSEPGVAREKLLCHPLCSCDKCEKLHTRCVAFGLRFRVLLVLSSFLKLWKKVLIKSQGTSQKNVYYIYRGYYRPARGYEFYLRVVNSISHE